MAPLQTNQDLSQALTTLQHSLYILFLHYKGYLKTMLLCLFIYLFYKLGNLSVKDQILHKQQQLTDLIQRRIAVRVQIPKKLQKIRKMNKIILLITSLLLIGYVIAYYLKYKVVTKNSALILTIVIGSVVTILSCLNVYKFLLSKKFRQNDSLQRIISKQLSQFSVALGPKVIKILKNHLCKQKASKLHQSLYSNECLKPDCKQIRGLYKIRNNGVEQLVQEVINFEWCSICKKRVSFNEYLGFQYRQFQKRGENQEQQVKNKMEYLCEGLQRMRKWLHETSPCNCSKLYWNMSTGKIIEYKKSAKSIQTRVKQLQTSKSYI